MPVNPSHEYENAEKQYLQATTLEEKIKAVEEMIRTCPKHKGSENLLAQLRSRLAKLKKEAARKGKKVKKSVLKKTGDAIVCLIGLTNSGKSLLLSKLTNAKPQISELPFTTTKPEQGILDYGGCLIQVIELPSFRGIQADSENLGIARMADILFIVAVSDAEINKINDELKEARITVPTFIVHNKADIIVKIPIHSKLSISAKTGQNIDKLKDIMFEKLKLIRIYTKETGKKPEKKPVVLKEDSTIKEFAAKIHKDFVKNFSHALIWGSSAKFPGQKIGFSHILKDQDIVEIHLKK